MVEINKLMEHIKHFNTDIVLQVSIHLYNKIKESCCILLYQNLLSTFKILIKNEKGCQEFYQTKKSDGSALDGS